MPKLPILRNGSPGTAVVFGEGAQVDGQLVFLRVRDLQPEELLSPERGRRMTLEPHLVASIAVDGRVV